jgi:hypothetical protein
MNSLRHLVDGRYPLRFKDDAKPIDVDYIDHAKPEIEDVLLDDVIFFGAHRAGAEYVIQRWALKLTLPKKAALR